MFHSSCYCNRWLKLLEKTSFNPHAMPSCYGAEQLKDELGLPCLGDLFLLMGIVENQRHGFYLRMCGRNIV